MDRVRDSWLCNIAHQRGYFFDPSEGSIAVRSCGGGRAALQINLDMNQWQEPGRL
jgi:hypothetical protein